MAQWVADVRKVTGEVPIVVVGNKVDLPERVVKPQEGSMMMRKLKARPLKRLRNPSPDRYMMYTICYTHIYNHIYIYIARDLLGMLLIGFHKPIKGDAGAILRLERAAWSLSSLLGS